MTIELRPACSDDYVFALELYIEAIRPLASAWIEWIETDQEAEFASLWRPTDTRIITLDGQEIGWVEFRRTGDEVFLKQLYIAHSHQRRGIGSRAMRLLLEKQREAAKSMALFVLKNNPSYRFYEHHGFKVVHETHSTFVMRRELIRAA
ncbi:GNAT family N-acetyltransferase [Microvirga sp. 3-52]|uniref:GNAT family N-acetyltransferase n=1 Tax=Microvirga sp. 3-52 TaxID=2792425 RepID=UPI001AD2E50E|nr:GNAT family N-acetyltransferase [Microvirga sp. 3-52]MBO1906353.1 GNAT family N-acetyltransferase [Microvirga sp. 3-52]MBS7453477.1 GNAT family N-acetyltransferase [Microvirga sp. 3-52]